MKKMIRGRGLCGGVRFEVEPPFIRAGHCHCERCRKHSGAAEKAEREGRAMDWESAIAYAFELAARERDLN
jgi:hypothetical protein